MSRLSECPKQKLCLPVTGAVFSQDTDESLNTSQDGSVDHDRPDEIVLALFGRCTVLKFETFRQVKVELFNKRLVTGRCSRQNSENTYLNGRTLEFTLEGITDGDIDLGTVELRTKRYQDI